MGPNKNTISRSFAPPCLAPRAARRDRARRDRTESDFPLGVTFVHTPQPPIYTDKTTLRVIRRLGGGGGNGEKETMVVLTVVMVVVLGMMVR
mgnify:CR=1 FL=1